MTIGPTTSIIGGLLWLAFGIMEGNLLGGIGAFALCLVIAAMLRLERRFWR